MDLEQFIEVISILEQEYPKWDAPAKRFESGYNRNPFTILCSTLLSFRTKDEVTLQAIQRLSQVANTPSDMLKLTPKEIEKLIYPVGFYRKKAKSLHSVAKELIDRFDGVVPNTIEELLSIKGVGVKTAQIVLESAFYQDIVAVDTHLHRILNMWQFIDTKSPEESAKVLNQKLPNKYKKGLNRLLVSFGQTICKPNYPECQNCPVRRYCHRTY